MFSSLRYKNNLFKGENLYKLQLLIYNMGNQITLIDNNVRTKKTKLLEYYRSRSDELIAESKQIYADSEYKKRASLVNKGLIEAKRNLLKILEQKSKKENWEKNEILEGVLIITYTNYVVMLEARNDVWSYEYMAFARRIGELWEPFCLLCWDHPINDNLNYFVPPLFKDVKTKLTKEIDELINKLEISQNDILPNLKVGVSC